MPQTAVRMHESNTAPGTPSWHCATTVYSTNNIIILRIITTTIDIQKELRSLPMLHLLSRRILSCRRAEWRRGGGERGTGESGHYMPWLSVTVSSLGTWRGGGGRQADRQAWFVHLENTFSRLTASRSKQREVILTLLLTLQQ